MCKNIGVFWIFLMYVIYCFWDFIVIFNNVRFYFFSIRMWVGVIYLRIFNWCFCVWNWNFVMNIDLYGLGGDECGKYRVDCCYMSMNIIVSGFID